MGRFEPAAGLDVKVAQRFAAPYLSRVLDMLEDAAKANAPGTRVWITMRDERVRRTHFDADAQMIPANLRFKVEHPSKPGQYELARHPRDPALSVENSINCRCDDPTLPHPLRDSIHQTQVTVTGTRVSGSVETRFPRAAESEFGTSEDEAARFMSNALRDVALRLKSGHAR